MSGDSPTMADLIDRLYPDRVREPDATRDDLPELARALAITGRVFLRGEDGAPAVYWAEPGPDGATLVVRRVAFLPRRVPDGTGRHAPADDATEARGARYAAEVPVPPLEGELG
jgi:hypothetical protein